MFGSLNDMYQKILLESSNRKNKLSVKIDESSWAKSIKTLATRSSLVDILVKFATF